MKSLKYISMIAAIAMIAIACDPLEDEIKEVEESSTVVKDLIYTMTDEDYELADAGFGSFSDIDDVKAMVPTVLSTNFPVLGKNSSALVSYQFYNGSSPDLRGTFTEWTIPSADYDLFHGYDGFETFGNPDVEVAEYANWKFTDGEDGDYADITFDYYDGSFHGGAVSRVVYTVAYGWQYAWPLPDEAYEAFGESASCFGVYDFSYDDEAFDVLHLYLNEFKTFLYEEGDIIIVEFNYDNGDDCNEDEEEGALVDPTEQDVAMYIFNGTEWKSYSDGYQTSTEVLNFGHDGNVWVPDNTIKYSITGGDFSAIVAGEVGNPDALANLDNFGNFNTGNWSHAEIVTAIGFVLKKNFPSSEEGQKYFVTYNTYPAGDLTVSLILDASGEYVEQGE